MNRREFSFKLLGMSLIAPLGLAGCDSESIAKEPERSLDVQNNWQQLLAADAQVETSTEPLELDEREWRDRLDPNQFDVLREEGTERAFSSPLDKQYSDGVYVCAGCGLPLFSSAMKFDSGTGWPSFYTAIPGRLTTKVDYKLIYPRTEYHCARCGGHQGHVFKDGPAPTGQRWCNNGVALKFIPANNGI